ncbi:MAG: trimeric intracellular cation channel family protein [Salibacteraceae bacterium]
MNELFEYIEIIGSFALAISGALTAIKKKFDGFGILIIAFVTAIGGGTIRDVLLPNREVFWLQDPKLVYVILFGTIFTIVFKSKQKFIYRPLMLFDAVGLGFFTILGVEIGISQGLDAIYCAIIGTITGTFGGITRDILVHRIPIIFRKEIYATISIFGGLIFYYLRFTEISLVWVKIIPISFIILSRLIVVRFELSLPSIYKYD